MPVPVETLPVSVSARALVSDRLPLFVVLNAPRLVITLGRVNVAVPTDEPLPKLPVARALWLPQPDLKTAAAAWIYAGGAHHTGYSYDLTAEHMADFAEMAGMEFLLIDSATTVSSFKKELRWNDLYYHLAKGL